MVRLRLRISLSDASEWLGWDWDPLFPWIGASFFAEARRDLFPTETFRLSPCFNW